MGIIYGISALAVFGFLIMLAIMAFNLVLGVFLIAIGAIVSLFTK
jgi:hypothetical protein